MKEVPVGRYVASGQYVALVDDEDYERLSKIKWHLHPGGATVYARNKAHGYMHRFIVGADDLTTVDHINGNGLDNRKENLRIAAKLNELNEV